MIFDTENIIKNIQDIECQENIPQIHVKKNKEKYVDDFLDDNGFVVDGLDDEAFYKFKKNENIPIDAWTFVQWRSYWKYKYESIWQTPQNITIKQFNIIFSNLFNEARSSYKMSNEEIRNYISWFCDYYVKYVKETNKQFYFKSIQYKLNDYYVKYIDHIEKRQNLLGKRIRDIIIDAENLKLYIDDNYDDNLGLLVKQLGYQNLVFYGIKFKYGEDEQAYKNVLKAIKERCAFENEINGSYTLYLETLIRNSIYFGPYPFEDKLTKINTPDCKIIFENFINNNNLRSRFWWIETFPQREMLKCVEKFSRKRISKNKKGEQINHGTSE